MRTALVLSTLALACSVNAVELQKADDTSVDFTTGGIIATTISYLANILIWLLPPDESCFHAGAWGAELFLTAILGNYETFA